MTMFMLNAESEPEVELAVNVKVAEVNAPTLKLVVAGFHVMLKNVPAFDGVQVPKLIDKVSATLPVFLM